MQQLANLFECIVSMGLENEECWKALPLQLSGRYQRYVKLWCMSFTVTIVLRTFSLWTFTVVVLRGNRRQ